MKTKHPLDRYKRIRTRRTDEFERALGRVFGAALCDLPNPSALDAYANFVELTDIAVGFAKSGTALTVRFEEADYARFQAPLRGKGVTASGSHSVSVGPRNPCVVSHGHSSSATYGADLENLFLRVSREALERKLALLIGRPLRGKLEFALDEFTSPAMLVGERRIVGLLVQLLDDETALVLPNALRELEEAAVVQLLYAARHNFSPLLAQEPRDTDSAAIRRVEAFLEAKWRLPITIETLVEVSGVSARSLYRTFEKTRGLAPMALVRDIRLKQARALLSLPDDKTSVTGVALACGFSSPGQFASDYRKRFGELPSFTLQKQRKT